MENTILALLTVAALCISSCYSAPLPSANEKEVKTRSDTKDHVLDKFEDLMMDPAAIMPQWQRQEGDITYLTDKFPFLNDENDPFIVQSEGRSKRAAIKNKYRLWKNGVVPYLFSDAYTESEKVVLIQAMDHLENNTCIRFVKRTNETDYIGIYPGSGCYSYVGRIGRSQGISVGRRCFAFHTALHEIVHALGFYHEQSRPDRDEHVEILSENILDNLEDNFEKLSENIIDSLGVGYDYNSIMHYDATLFSRNGKPTIVALDPDIPVGKARELSELDIEQINRLYGCPDVPPPRKTIAPPHVEEGPSFPEELPYPDCGGFITSLEGTIKSPGFPNYPHNMDCVWIFNMPLTGFNIIFDFEPFHIEESPNCESDYIQIYESLDTSGYTSGRFCGNHYSKYSMSSIKSYAYLHFHTNGSNETPNLKGFSLKYYVIDIDECHPWWKQCSHGCHNFEGGYDCSCPEGFFMSIDGQNCFDINECALDDKGCDHKCVNTAGSYHCACEDGYTLHSDNKTCLEEGKANLCIVANCEHGCEIVDGLAQCLCPKGYQIDADGQLCADINECLDNNGDCEHNCHNSNGSYSCSCQSGYELTSDSKTCQRVDPCTVNNGGCDHVCTSSGNSVVCSCRVGYELAVDGTSCNDIDECSSNGGKGDCDHTCTNTVGSFVCSCPTGYELNTDGITCEDVDECKVNNGGCQELQCFNQEGSFQCRCGEGFKMRDDENSCATVLAESSGEIETDNWPETYPNNVNEQWLIQCKSNQVVDITFSENFGIAGSIPDCSKDWLKLYDGDSTGAELLGKFCHQTIPQVPKSSSNSVLVHFYAGPHHSPSRRGFELLYTCEDVAEALPLPSVKTLTSTENELISSTESDDQLTTESPSVLLSQPTECGKTLFTESSGTIESPNWPETYPTDLQCEYFIELPNEDDTIEITFSEGFGIAGNYPECPKDWVMVYDGHTTVDDDLFGKYCQWEKPPTIVSSGRKAKIVLFAGESHSPSRKGFSASYRTL